jgi:adenylate kinase
MPVIPHTFSLSGSFAAGVKLLYFGAAGTLPARLAAEARSLKIEHVSPEALVHQEICRRTPLGRQAQQARQHGAAVPDQTLLAILRKWFWARKPDAGFLLEGFPATLLHARLFDEWLEAREEALTGCLWAGPAANPAVLEHYRTLGLLLEPGPSAGAPV